jgi:hypothetical protein
MQWRSLSSDKINEDDDDDEEVEGRTNPAKCTTKAAEEADVKSPRRDIIYYY